MTEERIRIEGPVEALEGIRRDLQDEGGAGIEVEPVSTAVPGELREPILVALLISVTSTAAVGIRTLGAIIERRMTHVERKELLRIYRERDGAEISLADLTAEGPDAR